MADCRECAGCLDVVGGVRILCVNSPVDPVTWAEALHDRCDDFRPKTAPVVDCRECVHVCDVVDGKSFRCSVIDQSPIPWHLVASDPCNEFRPKPTPASPPASADREWVDVLGAAREFLSAVRTLPVPLSLPKKLPASRRVWDALGALSIAISSEEARRARPAVEDPRDALLRQCAADFARVRDCEPDLDAHLNMRRIASGALEALRAAGVEPAPEQEEEASR